MTLYYFDQYATIRERSFAEWEFVISSPGGSTTFVAPYTSNNRTYHPTREAAISWKREQLEIEYQEKYRAFKTACEAREAFNALYPHPGTVLPRSERINAPHNHCGDDAA